MFDTVRAKLGLPTKKDDVMKDYNRLFTLYPRCKDAWGLYGSVESGTPHDAESGHIIVEKFISFILGKPEGGRFESILKTKLFEGFDIKKDYRNTVLEDLFFKLWDPKLGENPVDIIPPDNLAVFLTDLLKRLQMCFAKSQPLTVKCASMMLDGIEKANQSRDDFMSLEINLYRGAEAHRENLDGKITMGALCRKCIYTMGLMEAVGNKVIEDESYNSKLIEFYSGAHRDNLNSQEAHHAGSVFLPLHNSSSLFALVKAKSVKWPEKIFHHILHQARSNVADLASLSRSLSNILRMNVLEAYIADNNVNLMTDNASAAAALNLAPDYPIYVRDQQVHYGMNAAYDALYFNWNLTFCTQMASFWLVCAKLVQPLVSCAAPDRFIIIRATSLKIAVETVRLQEKRGYAWVERLPLFSKDVRRTMGLLNRQAAKVFVANCTKYTWAMIGDMPSRLKRIVKAIPSLLHGLPFLMTSDETENDSPQPSPPSPQPRSLPMVQRRLIRRGYDKKDIDPLL